MSSEASKGKQMKHVKKQPTHGIKLQVCVCVYPIMQVHEHMNGASHYKLNYRDSLLFEMKEHCSEIIE